MKSPAQQHANSGDWPWNPKIDAPEYIICAAIWFDDMEEHGAQPKNIESGFVVTGRRHHNCYRTIAIIDKNSVYKGYDSQQGFLTSKDRFLTRSEAMELAIKTGQTNRTEGELYSEDLY